MRKVSIEDQGRGGTVTYDEGGGRRLACYWEFGGGEVVACVSCGTAEDWSRHAWTQGRRAAILQSIADEVVRQKAPSCRAEIDQTSGAIVLRQSAGAPGAPTRPQVSIARPRLDPTAVPAATRAEEARWVFRLSALRAKLGLVVLAAALLLGGGVWLKDTLFSIKPGKGTAIGDTVRTDRHIATLIQSLEPYVPTLDRNHGNDRYGVSLFLVPLDGSPPRLIPLREGLEPGAIGTAKILGSDGRTLWFNVAGLGGVDVADYSLRPESELAAIDPRSLPRPWGDWPMAPRPERLLDEDAAPATTYLDAALLRSSVSSAPVRFDDPPGALLLHRSIPGAQGTAVVTRIDEAGNAVWRVDTGISRFGLQQILPGPESTAFVGPRPPVPDKVSEPLLVIIDHGTGKAVTHSLWQ